MASPAWSFLFNLELYFITRNGCGISLKPALFLSKRGQNPHPRQPHLTNSLLPSLCPITAREMLSLRVISLSCVVPARVITARSSLLREVKLPSAELDESTLGKASLRLEGLWALLDLKWAPNLELLSLQCSAVSPPCPALSRTGKGYSGQKKKGEKEGKTHQK